MHSTSSLSFLAAHLGNKQLISWYYNIQTEPKDSSVPSFPSLSVLCMPMTIRLLNFSLRSRQRAWNDSRRVFMSLDNASRTARTCRVVTKNSATRKTPTKPCNRLTCEGSSGVLVDERSNLQRNSADCFDDVFRALDDR